MNPRVVLLLAALFLTLVILFTYSRREDFSVKDIFNKVKDVGKNVGKKVVDVSKDIGGRIIGIGKGVVGKVGDVFDGGDGKIEVSGKRFDDNFAPIYVYRERSSNGTWTCPRGTVDYGTNDDKQCLASELGPMISRNTPNGWGMACPEGTVPNPGTDLPNQRCVRGWSQRRFIDGGWKCYPTDTDTGVSWENAGWWAAWRQCAKGEYPSVTTRVWNGNNWSCPPGTDDTGLSWSDGADGFKQCKVRAGG